MIIIKYIVILIIIGCILKLFLASSLLKTILMPITNKKIKNKYINLIVIYRINYFNKVGKRYEIDNVLYNKLLGKKELSKEELNILNKYI